MGSKVPHSAETAASDRIRPSDKTRALDRTRVSDKTPIRYSDRARIPQLRPKTQLAGRIQLDRIQLDRTRLARTQTAIRRKRVPMHPSLAHPSPALEPIPTDRLAATVLPTNLEARNSVEHRLSE